ncbi:MAG: hypothetical protein ACYDAP_03425 [Thermoplasmataceae archaeon]
MELRRKEKKDLDDYWLNKKVRVVMGMGESTATYDGTLKAELSHGILLESDMNKRIYIQFESITSIEEL